MASSQYPQRRSPTPSLKNKEVTEVDQREEGGQARSTALAKALKSTQGTASLSEGRKVASRGPREEDAGRQITNGPGLVLSELG